MLLPSVLTFDGPAGPSVLLLRKTGRGRHAAQLCLPGGFHDEQRDKDLRATALRELQEETGMAREGRGAVELGAPLGVFRTQKTDIDVTAFQGCFDYFDVVYRAGKYVHDAIVRIWRAVVWSYMYVACSFVHCGLTECFAQMCVAEAAALRWVCLWTKLRLTEY